MAIAVFSLNLNAQAKFGVMAGYTNISEKISYDGYSVSSGESGFFVGGVLDLTVSDKFHVQPELLYAHASEVNFLYLPVLAKYMVTNEFSVLAGPQANFILDETFNDYNSFGLDLTFGANYKITQNFFVEARYGFELTNRLSNMSGLEENMKDRFNTLNIGVGYMF